jgi:hypothetical protein
MIKIVMKELGVIKSCQVVFEKNMNDLFITSIIYWKHNIIFNICTFSPIFSNYFILNALTDQSVPDWQSLKLLLNT